MKRHRLLLMSLAQLAPFALLAWWARKHPSPALDVGITHVFQKQQSSRSQSAARACSAFIGSSAFLNVLVVPTALLFWKRHLRLEAIMTLVVSWTTSLLKMLIQSLVSRPRPSPLLVRVTDKKKSKSFPSGHVTSSLAFWGWLLSLSILHRGSNWPGRKVMLSLPALFVVLVGPTRIYLGEHWTTDVLGGYLFGGGLLGLHLRLYLYLRDIGDAYATINSGSFARQSPPTLAATR